MRRRVFVLLLIFLSFTKFSFAQDQDTVTPSSAPAENQVTNEPEPIPQEFTDLFDQLKCDYEEFARRQTVTAIYNHWVKNHDLIDYINRFINESKLDECQLVSFAELLINTWTKYHPSLLRAYLPYAKDIATRKSDGKFKVASSRICMFEDTAGNGKWFNLFLAALSSREGMTAASEIILDPNTDKTVRLVLFNAVFVCDFKPEKKRITQLPSFGRQIRLIPLNNRPEAVTLLKQLVLNPLDIRDEVFLAANSRQDIIDDQALAATFRPDQFGENINCQELQAYATNGKKDTLTAIDAPSLVQLQTADINVGNRILVGFNIALNTGEKPAQSWINIAKTIVLSAFKSQTLSPEQLTEGKQLITNFPEEWPANDYIRGPLKVIEAQLEKGNIEGAKRSTAELKTYLRTYQLGDTLANAAIDKVVAFIDSIVATQGRVMIKTSVEKCDSNELKIKDNVFRSDLLLLALQVLGLAQDTEGLSICRSFVDKKAETNYKLAAVLCLLWNGADAQDMNRVLSSGLKATQFIADDVRHYNQFFVENIATINNTQSQQTIYTIVTAEIDYCRQHANPGCYSYGFIDALLKAKALPLRTKSQLILFSIMYRDQSDGQWKYDCTASGGPITKWSKYCLASGDKISIALCLATLWENSGHAGEPFVNPLGRQFGLYEGKGCKEAAALFSASLDWPAAKEILETKIHGESGTTTTIAVAILKPQKTKDRKKYLLKFLGIVPKGSALDMEIRAMLREK